MYHAQVSEREWIFGSTNIFAGVIVDLASPVVSLGEFGIPVF